VQSKWHLSKQFLLIDRKNKDELPEDFAQQFGPFETVFTYEDTTYELIGVVFYFSQSKHYTVALKMPNEKWYLCDDNRVVEYTENLPIHKVATSALYKNAQSFMNETLTAGVRKLQLQMMSALDMMKHHTVNTLSKRTFEYTTIDNACAEPHNLKR